MSADTSIVDRQTTDPEHLCRPEALARRAPPVRKRRRFRASTPSSSPRSGLITVTGGKWTTYRRMAIDAVDQAARVGNLSAVPSPTAGLKLHGWQHDLGVSMIRSSVYGSDRSALSDLAVEHPEWNQLLHPSLPYRGSEVVWAARHEAARRVEDVLARERAHFC